MRFTRGLFNILKYSEKCASVKQINQHGALVDGPQSNFTLDSGCDCQSLFWGNLHPDNIIDFLPTHYPEGTSEPFVVLLIKEDI